MTDRAYVDISQAAAGENVGKLGMTKKILCWPKKTYDGDAALELIPQKQGEPFSVTVPLGGKDFSDKDALSIAVNGATPCDMIKIEVYGANGEKSVDEINFFNDRWSRLLVSLEGNSAVCAAEKMVVSFYSVKGIPVENENAYIGEIYFGNIVDFRFGTAEQTHAGLHQRIDANDEQHHGACGSGEHLKPGPAPSTSVAGLAAHQYGGDCGCRQHGHVGEHMTGIHQQGQ